MIAPLAIGAGAITELVVLGELGDAMPWAKPAGDRGRRRMRGPARDRGGRPVRAVVVAVAMAALLAAPAAWAADTLGHADQRHVPGRRAGERVDRRSGWRRPWRRLWRRRPRWRWPGWRPGFGGARRRERGGAAGGAPGRPGGRAAVPGAGSGRRRAFGRRRRLAGGGAGGGFGGDSASLTAAIRYAEAARRRHDRRLQPEHRGRRDPVLERERRRARRLLGP